MDVIFDFVSISLLHEYFINQGCKFYFRTNFENILGILTVKNELRGICCRWQYHNIYNLLNELNVVSILSTNHVFYTPFQSVYMFFHRPERG